MPPPSPRPRRYWHPVRALAAAALLTAGLLSGVPAAAAGVDAGQEPAHEPATAELGASSARQQPSPGTEISPSPDAAPADADPGPDADADAVTEPAAEPATEPATEPASAELGAKSASPQPSPGTEISPGPGPNPHADDAAAELGAKSASSQPSAGTENSSSPSPGPGPGPESADAGAFAAAAVPVDAAAPVRAAESVITSAAAWLAGELESDGTVGGSFPDGTGGTIEFTDYGRSLDSALALLAAGGQDAVLGRTLASVEEAAAIGEYTQGGGFGDRADAAYVGATAKLAFVVEVTGGDATSVGGVDLIAQLLSLVTTDGRFADRSNFGNFANLFGHAFALLALDTAGRVPDQALVQGLLAAQCPDGSFPVTYEPVAGSLCTGSVDSTGLVLQALGALDLASSPAAVAATAWLLSQQRADGSFPGEAPVNSTGYAVLGLNAVGAPTGGAVPYLVSQQNQDGGLRTGAPDSPGSDLFATAQALPALVGTTFQGSARPVARATAAPEADPAPTNPPVPMPSPTASLDPNLFAPTHGDVFCEDGRTFVILVGQAGPTDPCGEGTSPVSINTGSGLPVTGTDLPALLLAGGVLLVVGATLTAGGRSRPQRGRHAAPR